MKMSGSTRYFLLAALCAVAIALCFVPTARGLVFGLDFGSRWIKMSVIRANSFEIILDAAAKRKFVNGLTFHDEERYFAGEAEKIMPRAPQNTYLYLGQLLGKFANSSAVTELQPHLFYADSIVPNGDRGTVAVRYDEDSTFAVEELVGMVLNFARATAEHYVSTPVADVVITVPPYFTVEERAALLDAASLAGFNVMSLVNDGTAIALHYAFGKRFEEPKVVLFYDMGHSNTRATLVEYTSLRIKKDGKNSTQSTLKVKAVAYDKHLGGRDFDMRLAEFLAGVAVQQMEAKGMTASVESIKQNKKAWARLLTAASQAKTVLSANTETFAAVEGLVGDYDLKTTVTRAQFEEMCADLFERVTIPLQQALDQGNMTIEAVNSVEIVGGSVRIPMVQTKLKNTFGLSDLSKTLNGDEAAVLGAVFYAAQMSSSVKGAEFKVKDITPYGVTATIKLNQPVVDEVNPEEEKTEALVNTTEKDDDSDDDDDDDEHETEQGDSFVKVLHLFKPNSRIGAKKTINFKKRLDNFTVELSYDNETSLPAGTPYQLTFYNFTDMTKLNKYNYTGRPKVSLVFRLSTSGLVELEKAEAEVTVIKYPEPEPETTATATPTPAENDNASTTESTSEQQEKEAAEDTQEKDEDETEKEEDEEEKTSETEDEETKEKKQKKEEKEKKKKAKKARKPRKVVHKVILTPTKQKLGIPERTYTEKAKARALLRQWENKAIAKREKAEAKNDLETYIYATKEKLYDEELEKVSTAEQRDEALEALSEAADWLEDEGMDVSTEEYRSKKESLVNLANPIFERKEELTKRPVQVAMLSFMLNHSRSSIENITERLRVEVEERDELLDLIEEAEDWLNAKVKEQEQKQPYEEPAFKSEQVQSRYAVIEKMLRKLLKRKPRATPTPDVNVTLNAETETNNEAEASQTDQESGATESGAGTPASEHQEETTKEEQVVPPKSDVEDIL